MRGDEHAVIGSGARIRGALRGREPLRIEGRVDGPIEIEGAVTVEAAGVVRGEVSATEIVVAGIVVGDLKARERLVLRPTAQVRGGLYAPKLVLEAGARVDGPLEVGRAEGLSAPAERPRPVVMAVRPIPEADTEVGEPGADDESDGAPRTRVVVKKRP